MALSYTVYRYIHDMGHIYILLIEDNCQWLPFILRFAGRTNPDCQHGLPGNPFAWNRVNGAQET